jgi:electron transport complex protein RnfD
MSPALGARCFLLISFPALMGGSWPAVGNLFGADVWGGFVQRMSTLSVDAASSATPLAVLQGGGQVDLLQAFFGLHTGCIGETSSLAILIGAAYMLLRGVISPRIPAVYVGSTLLFVTVFNLMTGSSLLSVNYLVGQVVTGGLLAGAVFMATDYVSSPITRGGQWIYAILLGFLTALFRVFGSSPEGVSYAIIIGNTLVPLIERVTMPRAFGQRQPNGGAVR